jgi:GPH family glycoside/pentoside/hexuronide:cation symporter
MSTPAKLTFGEKFGYGLGDTASNFVWGTMMSFLMFYYTDIFGISAAAVGTLFLFARVSDGGVDFLMGAIADRTRTRAGKFRPYLLWMSIPLALTFILTFTTPSIGITGKIVYAWITYNLLMVFYTAINIPYSALSGVMTDDPLDRTSLNSYRMAMAQVGGFIVNAATLPLIVYFGHHNQAAGYQRTVMVFAVISVLLFLATYATTRERIHPPAAQKTKLGEDLKTLFANRHWVIMFAAGITALTFIIIRGGTLLYYCKYYLGFDAKQTSTFLVLGNVGFIAGAISTRFIVKAFGKKNSYILTQLGLAASCAVFYFLAPGQIDVIYALQILNGAVGGMNATLYWAMIADTADFAEWRFGVRTTGIVFSATTCSQKVGMGIGGAVSGALLTHFGYVAGVAQTTHANHGILLLVSLIPAAGYFFIACIFGLYGLTEPLCHKMREDLAARRAERDMAADGVAAGA